MNKFKRSLASLLACITVFGTCITTPVFAEDSTTATTSSTTETATTETKATATAEPTAAPTAEPAATVEPTAAPTAEPVATVEPTAVPTAEPAATVEPTAAPTAEPAATVEPTAAPTAAPAATVETVAMPAQRFASTSENGVFVSVEADENTFPGGTSMKVTPVEKETAINAAAEVTAEDTNIVDAVAVDISFYDKNGNEIEPANENNVHVTMSTSTEVTGDEHELIHISDDNSVQKVAANQIDKDGADFKASKFSVYVIVGGIKGATHKTDSYSVLSGETITLHESYTYDYFTYSWSIDSGSQYAALSNQKTSAPATTDIAISSSAPAGTEIVVKCSYAGNWYDTFVITVLAKAVVSFDKNGGSVAAPAAITEKAGTTITLPSYTGTRKGYIFSGWSLNGIANSDGQYKPGNLGTVYPAGSEYTANSDVTFYAVWSSENVKAEYYVRLDGIIPTEPQGHPVSEYTAQSASMTGTIKVATFYTNTTVNRVNYGLSGVGSFLGTVPSDNAIKAACKAKGISYDPNTQYVLWYVIKAESTWHVDGVLLSKAKVNLSYDPNVPTGASGTWSNMPDGQEYTIGATATVSDKIPTLTGYTFTGWEDAEGNAYSGDDSFTIVKDTVLYAQWEAKNSTHYTVQWIDAENNSVMQTVQRTGKTDSEAKVNDTDKAFANYTYAGDSYPGTILKGTILADESLVLKMFFKKNLIITAKSDSKTYDGNALTNSGYTLTAGTLAEGDEITSVTVSGSQTDAGFSDNIASDAVIMHNQTDVTAKYNITYVKGILTVDPVAIELTAGSAKRAYNGEALTAHTYTTAGAFVGNDGLDSVTYEGSQTFVGTSVNTITAYTLKDGVNDKNYIITTKTGTLEVTKASIAITIKANDDSQTYNATALTNSGYSLKTGTLATGDAIASAAVVGTQTDAGSSDNLISNAVIKHGDVNVTDNYVITYEKGTLTVNPIVIELTAASASRAYNGEALTAKGYSLTQGAFIGNDGIASETNEGSQTFVGSSPNTIKSYTLKDGTKAGNYTITTQPGTLTITKASIAITIKADDGSKTYDAEPLTMNSYKMTAGTLATGDAIANVTVAGTLTNAGSVKNTASAAVIKHGTTVVTENYQITYLTGTLTVSPVAIELTADSASRAYNGIALTANGYSTTKGAFVGNDGIASAKVEGSQLYAGSSANTITAYTLKAGTNADNYAITTKPGTLTITAAANEITIKAADDSKTYDGTALTNDGYSITVGTLFDGDELTSTTVTGSRTEAGSADNIPSAAVIMHGETDVTANYSITYKKGTLNVAKRAITITARGGEKTYDSTALTNNGYDLTDGSLADNEEITSVTVTGSQTQAGTSKNTPSAAVIKHGEAEVTSNYEIKYVDGSLTVNPVKILLTANSASRAYNGFALTDSGYQLTSGAFVGNDGFASVTVEGSQMFAGSSPNIITAYTFKKDVNPKNYTITSAPGTLTVTQASIAITIKAADDTMPYDGTALTNDGYSLTAGALVGNDIIASVEVAGARIDAGSSDNTASAAVIMNGITNVTANYNISYLPGTLTVTPIDLELTANSDSKPFDGTALVNDGYSITAGKLVDGDELISADVAGTQTNAGTSANGISNALIARGDEIITKNYNIFYVNGTLTVDPLAITLTANSGTKLYDGTALTNNGYSLTAGKLAEGDAIISADVAGTQTNAGTSANVVSNALIERPDMNDTKNYKITYVNGTLTVSKRNITLTSGTSTKVFDGTALTNNNVAVSGDGFVTGEGAVYTVTGTQTAAGSSANTFTYAMNANTNADNYNVTVVTGTLTVTAAPETPITPKTPATPTPVPTEEPATPTTDNRPSTPETTARPSTPNTGDQTNVPLYAGMMSLAALMAMLALIWKKRNAQ
jgi:uncharacterized repeat protein (TIGR02543 family)